MSFIEEIKLKAKSDIKTIVLPEADDIRTLEATEIVLKEGYANIILVGKEREIRELAKIRDLDIADAMIVTPEISKHYEEYVQEFYKLRKEKGMTLEKAKELVLDPVYFGMMMIKKGDADRISIWSCTLNIRYTSTSTSNIKNSS